MKTLTTHYINGSFVESHGREVMDIIKPANGQVIGRVTLADEEDTRHAIAAAKSAFATFGRSTKGERARILSLATLPPIEEKVVRLSYGIGCERPHSVAEIAVEFGVGADLVAAILEQAEQRLAECGVPREQ